MLITYIFAEIFVPLLSYEISIYIYIYICIKSYIISIVTEFALHL